MNKLELILTGVTYIHEGKKEAVLSPDMHINGDVNLMSLVAYIDSENEESSHAVILNMIKNHVPNNMSFKVRVDAEVNVDRSDLIYYLTIPESVKILEWEPHVVHDEGSSFGNLSEESI